MSNAIWARQKGLAEGLTAAGVRTHAALPGRVTAPFRYVLLGGLDSGQTFGAYVVTLQVLCVGQGGENAAVVEQITDMAVEVVRAVPGLDGYGLSNPAVGEPGDYIHIDGQRHLAVPVLVTARITRAELEV